MPVPRFDDFRPVFDHSRSVMLCQLEKSNSHDMIHGIVD